MLSKNTLFRFLIALYIGASVFALTNPGLKWNKSEPTTIPVVANSPTDIKIPKINLDLAVSPAILKGNEWQLFDDRVAWLSTSSLPGKGNTIMYAHDRIGLFGNLKNLKTGDEIDIYTDKWISYKVSEVRAVAPNNVNAVLGTANRLTLYTCDGSFDQKRLVVYAE